MKRRRLMAGALSILVVTACSVSVSALEPTAEDGFESAPQSSEYTDLLEVNPKIVESVNSCLGTDNDLNGIEPITEADIDWNRAYKFYVDCNVFEESEPNSDALYDYFNQQYYIWQVPFTVEGINVYVNLERGIPPTEDIRKILTSKQWDEMESNVGKYIVTSVAVDAEIPSYREQFNELVAGNSELEDSTKIMVGGMGKMRSAFGLCVSDQGIEQVTLLEVPRLAEEPRKTKVVLPKLEQYQSYSFEEMVQVMEAVPGPTKEEPISSKIPFMILYIVCIAGIGFMVFALWRRHKRFEQPKM